MKTHSHDHLFSIAKNGASMLHLQTLPEEVANTRAPKFGRLD